MTISQILIYSGAAFSATEGIAHLIPTKNIVAGFGDINEYNRNIMAMERVPLILMKRWLHW